MYNDVAASIPTFTINKSCGKHRNDRTNPFSTFVRETSFKHTDGREWLNSRGSDEQVKKWNNEMTPKSSFSGRGLSCFIYIKNNMYAQFQKMHYLLNRII